MKVVLYVFLLLFAVLQSWVCCTDLVVGNDVARDQLQTSSLRIVFYVD